jgi:hypothetical protein
MPVSARSRNKNERLKGNGAFYTGGTCDASATKLRELSFKLTNAVFLVNRHPAFNGLERYALTVFLATTYNENDHRDRLR